MKAETEKLISDAMESVNNSFALFEKHLLTLEPEQRKTMTELNNKLKIAFVNRDTDAISDLMEGIKNMMK